MIDNQELDQNIDIPADTFSAIFKHSQKVRRNPLQDHFSLKINTPFLITQHGGSGACGGMTEKFPPLPPFRHMLFLYFMCGFCGYCGFQNR